MKSLKDVQNCSTDSLEQKLLSTRYSVIQQMVTLKDSLSRQHKLLTSQRSKAEDLKKKITLLASHENYNNKKALQLQDKLTKIQSSQDLAISIMRMKALAYRQREIRLEQRRRECFLMKTSLERTKRQSLSYFESKKMDRVNRIKQQLSDQQLEFRMKQQKQMQRRKAMSNQVKMGQTSARQRLRRYQNFKLAQAKFNYDNKKIDLLVKYSKDIAQLNKLNENLGQEEKIFKKAQVLGQEANQAQSFYLTKC